MNSQIFKALGNETRLKIIETLMIKEHNVSDLTRISNKDQTTVSRHLSTLVNAKIIKQKRLGYFASSGKKKRDFKHLKRCPCVASSYLSCSLKAKLPSCCDAQSCVTCAQQDFTINVLFH